VSLIKALIRLNSRKNMPLIKSIIKAVRAPTAVVGGKQDQSCFLNINRLVVELDMVGATFYAKLKCIVFLLTWSNNRTLLVFFAPRSANRHHD
jgi:hypothetical protein